MAAEQLQRGCRVVRRNDHAEAAAHVEDLVQLGVVHAAPLSNVHEHRRHRQGGIYPVSRVGLEPQQVQEAVPGDVGQAPHVHVRAEQLADRLHVDHRRLEQHVAHRLVPDLLVEIGEHTTGEAQAVGVDAAGGHADQSVARLDARAGHDRVEVHEPGAEADEVESPRRGMAAHDVRQHGQLTARDLDAGQLRTRTETEPDLLQHLGIGLLDGDVVKQRDRVGAHADHVVGVHAEQVDADRVVAPELLAHDHLRADAVAGQRQAAPPVELQDVRVVPACQSGTRRPPGADAGQHLHQRRDGVAREQLVDAGARVCPFGHGPHSSGSGGVRRAARGAVRRCAAGRAPRRRPRSRPPRP